MSTVTDLVAGLVRAANEVERLQEAEARRLLSSALRTIRDLRMEGGIPPRPDNTDEAAELLEACYQLHYGVADAEGVRQALLKAAMMIRDLHILQDSRKPRLH